MLSYFFRVTIIFILFHNTKFFSSWKMSEWLSWTLEKKKNTTVANLGFCIWSHSFSWTLENLEGIHEIFFTLIMAQTFFTFINTWFVQVYLVLHSDNLDQGVILYNLKFIIWYMIYTSIIFCIYSDKFILLWPLHDGQRFNKFVWFNNSTVLVLGCLQM